MQVVSFEGVGGAGKSTVAELIAQEYSSRGKKIFLDKPITRQRLEGALGAFLDKKEKVWVCSLPWVPPRVEALSYLAFLVKDNEEIFNEQNKYDLIIFDRYIDTVSAHVIARNNILGRQLSFEDFYLWFKSIYEREIKIPNKTLVFDVSLTVGEQRAIKRENKGYTREDKQGFSIIKKFYKFLADHEPERFRFIDANKSIEHVVREVMGVLENVQ